MKDHYRTLGVPENASEQEIKVAYRRLAKRYHPDVNAGAKGAEERFKEIVEAYNILSDAVLRRSYDTRRLRQDLFSGGSGYYYAEPKKEKKDPRRKEYSEEDLEFARARHKKKTEAQMARRKKLLTGMIITFVIYLCASAGFEYWIEQRRKKESQEMSAILETMRKKNQNEEKLSISNMDSPFDPLFGAAEYTDSSKNHFVIYMSFSDAVVCAVQSDPPYHTIRNEYIEARNGFVMPHLPEGNYDIKLYTGKNWDVNKKIPDGRKLGGFTKEEGFYKVHEGPFRLQSVFRAKSDTITFDTIFLDPRRLKFDTITRNSFFDPGQK